MHMAGIGLARSVSGLPSSYILRKDLASMEIACLLHDSLVPR